jgi:hypothetical protein
VEYFDLIRALSKSAAFVTPEQAECALFTTLEVLGALLPNWLLRHLAEELPAECEQALGLGASISLGMRRTPQHDLVGRELIHPQAIYALLVPQFSPRLVRHLERELPAFLRRPAQTSLARPAAPDSAQREVSRVASLPHSALRRSGR